MSRRFFLMAAVALFLLSTNEIQAQRWVLLGERHVSDRIDHDSIPVTASQGGWTGIKLKVLQAPVRFYNLKVVYGNETVDEIPIRFLIPKGGESRVIDLAGGSRVIKRIEFWYDAKTVGAGGAVVRVWGRR